MKQSYRLGNPAVQDLADRLAIQQLLSQNQSLCSQLCSRLVFSEDAIRQQLNALYNPDAIIDLSSIGSFCAPYSSLNYSKQRYMTLLFALGSIQDSAIQLDQCSQSELRQSATGETNVSYALQTDSEDSVIIKIASRKPCMIDTYSQQHGRWQFASRRLVLGDNNIE